MSDEPALKIVLWGSGGHGGVVLDAVRQQGVYEPVAFLEDGASNQVPKDRSELPVLCGREHLATLRRGGVGGMVIAIGDETTRVALAAIAVGAGFELCSIIHPSAVICPDVRLGAGTVVFAGSIVQTGSKIGDNVIINTSACVDHDCSIGDGAQLAPRVALGGRVRIGACTFVGIGTTVIDKIIVGRNCVIGAGSVVVRDIPDDTVAYGVPARIIRRRSSI